MEQTVFMGRGNSKAEFLGFRGRRQAAATDSDISLPEVRSTEIIRAGDVTRVAAGERLVLCVAAFASAQPLCRATVRPPSSLEISRVTNRGSPCAFEPVPNVNPWRLSRTHPTCAPASVTRRSRCRIRWGYCGAGRCYRFFNSCKLAQNRSPFAF